MFTGIIQEIGTLQRISPGKAYKLRIGANAILRDIERGDSISVDGACLTVAEFDGSAFEADAMPETIERTTLKYLQLGSRVNLEPALKLGDKMGGHWVAGHVDGTGTILSKQKVANSFIYEFSLIPELAVQLAPKGSVAVDGISLTVIECAHNSFKTGLIPHTLETTTLGEKSVGSHVNLETDIIGKYIHKYIKRPSEGAVTEKLLRESGFM